MSVWRVGSKVPLNVYEGDRPVCQCHTAEDAAKIVNAMEVADNAMRLLRDLGFNRQNPDHPIWERWYGVKEYGARQ